MFYIFANINAEACDDTLEEASLLCIIGVISPRAMPKTVAKATEDVDFVVAFDVGANADGWGDEPIRL